LGGSRFYSILQVIAWCDCSGMRILWILWIFGISTCLFHPFPKFEVHWASRPLRYWTFEATKPVYRVYRVHPCATHLEQKISDPSDQSCAPVFCSPVQLPLALARVCRWIRAKWEKLWIESKLWLTRCRCPQVCKVINTAKHGPCQSVQSKKTVVVVLSLKAHRNLAVHRHA